MPLALKLAGRMIAREYRAKVKLVDILAELEDREERLKLAGAEQRPGFAMTSPSLRAVFGMSYDLLSDKASKRAFRLLGAFGDKPFSCVRKHAQENWRGVELELGQIRRGFESVTPLPLSRTRKALEYFKNNLSPIHQPLALSYFAAMDSFFDHRGLWDEQLRWAQKVLELAKSIWDHEMEWRLYNKSGSIYAKKGLWDDALMSYKCSLATSERYNYQTGLAATFINIGLVYENKSEWDHAINHYKRSLAILERIDDKAGLATTLNNIGSIHYKQGEWDKALKYYERSELIYDMIKDLNGQALAKSNIGLIYARKEVWDKAFALLERSRQIFEQLGDRFRLASTLNNIGGVYYYNKGEFEKALQHLREAQNICKDKINDQAALEQPLAQTLHNIARVYHIQNNLEEALMYYEQSLIIREKLGERAELAQTLWKMSELYETQGQLEQAEQILTQAVAIFKEVGSPDYEQANQQLEKIKALQQRALQNR